MTEANVPSYVILCPIPQEVALKAGETSTVTFFNALKPTLEIRKVDSVTGDPVKGAKFQIWYASNHTDSGELNDLGTYYTDESGKIILPEVKDGWYKVYTIAPEDFGLTRCQKADLVGGSPAENAQITRDILNGAKGPKRDAVLLNAGAALYIGGKAETLAQGVTLAAELIDSGKAAQTLQGLIDVSNRAED